MTNITFGDMAQIERRKKSEAWSVFESEVERLLVDHKGALGWGKMGYIIASMADIVCQESEDTKAIIEFQNGFAEYQRENKAFLKEEDFPQ